MHIIAMPKSFAREECVFVAFQKETWAKFFTLLGNSFETMLLLYLIKLVACN